MFYPSVWMTFSCYIRSSSYAATLQRTWSSYTAIQQLNNEYLLPSSSRYSPDWIYHNWLWKSGRPVNDSRYTPQKKWYHQVVGWIYEVPKWYAYPSYLDYISHRYYSKWQDCSILWEAVSIAVGELHIIESSHPRLLTVYLTIVYLISPNFVVREHNEEL